MIKNNKYIVEIELLKDFYNSSIDKKKARKELSKFFSGIKYNNIFIVPSVYLDKQYRLGPSDTDYIIDSNKWSDLKDIMLDNTNVFDNYFTNLKVETIVQFQKTYEKHERNFVKEAIHYLIDFSKLDLPIEDMITQLKTPSSITGFLKSIQNYIEYINNDPEKKQYDSTIEKIIDILLEKEEYIPYQSNSFPNKMLLELISINATTEKSIIFLSKIVDKAFSLDAADYMDFLNLRNKYKNEHVDLYSQYYKNNNTAFNLEDLNETGKLEQVLESYHYKYHFEVIMEKVLNIKGVNEIKNQLPYLWENIENFSKVTKLLFKDVEGFHDIKASYNQRYLDIMITYQKDTKKTRILTENMISYILFEQDHKCKNSVESIEDTMLKLKNVWLLDNSLNHKKKESIKKFKV